MTRLQRLKRFLSYFWKNSAIIVGFSVVFIALPVTLMEWEEYKLWFWIIVAVNTLNLAITIFQYIRYIRFGR